MDCSPPGSSVYGISQARILEKVDISSFRGSSQPRDWTHVFCVSCFAGIFFYLWTTREARSTYLTKHFLAQYVQGKLKKNESMFEYLKSFQTLRNTTLRSLRNPWCSQTLSFTRHGSGLPEIPLAVHPGLSRTSTRNTDSHGLMTWAISFKLENSWISRKVYTRKRQPPT